MAVAELTQSFLQAGQGFLDWVEYGPVPRSVEDVTGMRLHPFKARRTPDGTWNVEKQADLQTMAVMGACADGMGGLSYRPSYYPVEGGQGLSLTAAIDFIAERNPEGMKTPGRDPWHPANVRKLMSLPTSSASTLKM